MSATVYYFDLARSTKELRDTRAFPFTYDRLLANAVSFLVRRSLPPAGLANGFAAVKVHFGEPGNFTFIAPHYIDPIVRALMADGLVPFLTDTTVLYRSPRSNAVGHASVAAEHGFAPPCVRAPVIIADGLLGNDSVDVPIGGKWFETVKIASAIAEAGSLVVVSHAKAHALMGFSGAIKNLGMGCASKPGKREQHAAGRTAGTRSAADVFPEKVCEYALGAARGKMVICVTFLTNIVPYCDCNAHADLPIVPDLGILFSSDPVAIDRAAYDLINRSRPIPGFVLARKPRRKDHFAALFPKTHPRRQMEYGTEIGLGTEAYVLAPIEGDFPPPEDPASPAGND